MGAMEKLCDREGGKLTNVEYLQLGNIASCASGAINVLNSVQLEGDHLEGALRALAELGANRGDGAYQALTIHVYAETLDLEPVDAVAAALHARVVALDKWTADCDPQHRTDANVIIEVAARCPLSDTPAGVGFEAERFADLVAFVSELPW